MFLHVIHLDELNKLRVNLLPFKMPAIQCHIAGCLFATPDVGGAVVAVKLGHHLSSSHPVPVGKKAPVIPPPKVTGNIYEDQWDCFTGEWAVYKDSCDYA